MITPTHHLPPPSSPSASQSIQSGPPITPVRDDPRFSRSTLPSHWPALKYVDESFTITLEAIVPRANPAKPVVNPFAFAEMQAQSTLYAQHKREHSRIRRHQSTAAVMMADHVPERAIRTQARAPFQPLFPPASVSSSQSEIHKSPSFIPFSTENTPPPSNQLSTTTTPPLLPLQKSFSSPATLRTRSVLASLSQSNNQNVFNQSNNQPPLNCDSRFPAVPATPSDRIIKRRKAAVGRTSVTPTNNENQPPQQSNTSTSCDMSMTPDSTPKARSPFLLRHPLYPMSNHHQIPLSTRHDIAKLREATLSIENTTP